MTQIPQYQAEPHYPAVGGTVLSGWEAVAATIPDRSVVLAVDGPVILDWTGVAEGIGKALAGRSVSDIRLIETMDYLRPWQEILDMTSTPQLADDPDFARLADIALDRLFGPLPATTAFPDEVLIVLGPGAALFPHEMLWYADLPKRYAEAAVNSGDGQNLGQRSEARQATTKRLFYVDWAVLDDHRDHITDDIELWVDMQKPSEPTALDGASLRATLAELAKSPFRTRPTFGSAPWGGHWGKSRLGLGEDLANTALGYELIAPESGLLIGDDECCVEVPFQFMMAMAADHVMGDALVDRFGKSFPIRFDYLDTFGGGNLSVHCHPQEKYMSEIFGWPYTQHESYYVMVGDESQNIYLGLRGDVDIEQFHNASHRAAHDGRSFEIEDYVQVHPAHPHQLFMIPAGTPHGSGEGNVVLEISATPYLYSLRFYDWLRRDTDGQLRSVHVEHAFANLDTDRRGEQVVSDLIQPVTTVENAEGWREEVIGSLPEVFYEIRRVVIDGDEPVTADTSDGFHVLNVVDGVGVTVETGDGRSHRLGYAETLVVPASVGTYRLRQLGEGPVRVVKAQIR